ISSLAGVVTVNNSTFSNNSAITYSGGGILNNLYSTLNVNNSTFSDNSANDSGGGIYNIEGTVNIGNTILNAGASGANLVNANGTITSQGYNLSSDDASAFLNQSTDKNSTNPNLGPLQNNGGP